MLSLFNYQLHVTFTEADPRPKKTKKKQRRLAATGVPHTSQPPTLYVDICSTEGISSSLWSLPRGSCSYQFGSSSEGSCAPEAPLRKNAPIASCYPQFRILLSLSLIGPKGCGGVVTSPTHLLRTASTGQEAEAAHTTTACRYLPYLPACTIREQMSADLASSQSQPPPASHQTIRCH